MSRATEVGKAIEARTRARRRRGRKLTQEGAGHQEHTEAAVLDSHAERLTLSRQLGNGAMPPPPPPPKPPRHAAASQVIDDDDVSYVDSDVFYSFLQKQKNSIQPYTRWGTLHHGKETKHMTLSP